MPADGRWDLTRCLKEQYKKGVSAVIIPSVRFSQLCCWRFKSSVRRTVPTFQRIIMPSPSHPNGTLLEKFDLDGEGDKILQNVRIYTVMRRITMFWSTTDHIYNSSPIIL